MNSGESAIEVSEASLLACDSSSSLDEETIRESFGYSKRQAFQHFDWRGEPLSLLPQCSPCLRGSKEKIPAAVYGNTEAQRSRREEPRRDSRKGVDRNRSGRPPSPRYLSFFEDFLLLESDAFDPLSPALLDSEPLEPLLSDPELPDADEEFEPDEELLSAAADFL